MNWIEVTVDNGQTANKQLIRLTEIVRLREELCGSSLCLRNDVILRLTDEYQPLANRIQSLCRFQPLHL